jgi:putative NADH-flavin reductase
MDLTVFGASGRTGREVVLQALERGHTVTAVVHDPDALAAQPDLTVVVGDPYDGGNVAMAIAGAEAVVNALGQRRGGPDDLLTVAGERIIDAMAELGVSRYVTLIGAGVREADETVSLPARVAGGLLNLVSGGSADAEAHVGQVTTSDLAWTVVRAPRLTGEPPGRYDHGTDIEPGFEGVSRADVAAFILRCVEEDLYVGERPLVGKRG